MRRLVPAIVLGLVTVSSSLGQWVEGQVYLPDSLGRLRWPSQVLFNPGNNIILVGGNSSNLLALDGVTGRRVALIPLEADVEHMIYAPELNLAYVSTGGQVEVVDPAALRRVGILDPGSGLDVYRLCWNGVEEKLYALCGATTVVFDARGESLLTFFRLPTSPYDLCCNPAGSRLYLGEGLDSGGVYIVDCANDSLRGFVFTGRGRFRMLYNEPANRVYVAEPSDEDVAILDGATDSLIRWIGFHGPVTEMAMSGDGARVFVLDPYDSRVLVIDGFGDTVRARLLLGDTLTPSKLAYNGVDRTVYVWCRDRFVALDADGDSVLTWFGFAGDVREVVHESVQNRLLLPLGSSEELAMVDCATNQEFRRVLTSFEPGRLALSAASNRVYCLGDALPNCLFPVDATTLEVLDRIAVGDAIRYLYHEPVADKLYLLSYRSDRPSEVLDCPSDSVVARLELGAAAGPAVTGPPGKVYFAASGPTYDVVVVVDALGDSILARVPVARGTRDLAYNPVQGRVYATSSDQDIVTVIDAGPDTVLATVPVPDCPDALAWATSRGLLFCGCRLADTVAVIDGTTNQVVRRIGAGAHPYAMLHNPLSDKLYVVCAFPPELAVIDCRTLEVAVTLAMSRMPYLVLDTLANRLHLFFQGQERRVLVLDCVRDSVIAEYLLPSEPFAAAWSAADRRFFFSLPDSGSLGLVQDSTLTGLAGGTLKDESRRMRRTVYRAPELALMDCRVLDIQGRDVTDERGRLAPGVYFLRERTASSSEHSGRTAVRKVILQR